MSGFTCIADEELEALRKELAEAQRVIAHLEAVVRFGECVYGECSWCEADMAAPENTHREDCMAFTLGGKVRREWQPTPHDGSPEVVTP